MDNPSLFETFGYYEYDDPFETVPDYAAYILHPENTTAVYTHIREHIRLNFRRRIPMWPIDLLELVLKLPEARALLSEPPYMPELHSASVLLSQVVDHLRGQSSDEETAS